MPKSDRLVIESRILPESDNPETLTFVLSRCRTELGIRIATLLKDEASGGVGLALGNYQEETEYDPTLFVTRVRVSVLVGAVRFALAETPPISMSPYPEAPPRAANRVRRACRIRLLDMD